MKVEVAQEAHEEWCAAVGHCQTDQELAMFFPWTEAWNRRADDVKAD